MVGRKRRGVLLLLLLLAMSGRAVAVQGKGKGGGPKVSKDVPLVIHFRDAPGDTVSSDNLGPYVDGIDGVAAYLNDATDDLILAVQDTPRSLIIDFTRPTNLTQHAPEWAVEEFPNAFLVAIDVANVPVSDPNDPQFDQVVWDAFCLSNLCGQTEDGMNFVQRGLVFSKLMGYQLCFQILDREAVVNDPDETAFVRVFHPNAETWLLIPGVVEVLHGNQPHPPFGELAGLIVTDQMARGKNKWVNSGQFIVPFETTVMCKNINCAPRD